MPKRLGMGLNYVCVAGAALAAALLPQLSWAALGEPESTVTEDVQQLAGSIKSSQRTSYRVHEIQLPSGTVLREYAAVGGSVFAVTWSGPSVPNLRQALGRYFDVYVTAARAEHGGRHHLQIRQSAFIMESSGHMRAFSGRAYLPNALPAGMSADELR